MNWWWCPDDHCDSCVLFELYSRGVYWPCIFYWFILSQLLLLIYNNSLYICLTKLLYVLGCFKNSHNMFGCVRNIVCMCIYIFHICMSLLVSSFGVYNFYIRYSYDVSIFIYLFVIFMLVVMCVVSSVWSVSAVVCGIVLKNVENSQLYRSVLRCTHVQVKRKCKKCPLPFL